MFSHRKLPVLSSDRKISGCVESQKFTGSVNQRKLLLYSVLVFSPMKLMVVFGHSTSIVVFSHREPLIVVIRQINFCKF